MGVGVLLGLLCLGCSLRHWSQGVYLEWPPLVSWKEGAAFGPEQLLRRRVCISQPHKSLQQIQTRWGPLPDTARHEAKCHPISAWWPYALSPKHIRAFYVHVDICRREVTRRGLMIRPLMMQELLFVSSCSRLCGLSPVAVTLCVCMHFIGRWSLSHFLSRYFPSS